MITCAPFVRMRSAAIAIDCKPEEQKRLIVIALVSTGRPARIAAARATFIPCSASGIAQPMLTSRISLVCRFGTRPITSLITVAPSSSGRVSRKVPLGALPTAVRTADTITAPFITASAALPLDMRKGCAFPLVYASFPQEALPPNSPARRSLAKYPSLFLGKAEPFRTSGGKAAYDKPTLVPQRLSRFQHMRNALLRFARAD